MDKGADTGGDDDKKGQNAEGEKINKAHTDKTDQSNTDGKDKASFDNLFEIHNIILHRQPYGQRHKQQRKQQGLCGNLHA